MADTPSTFDLRHPPPPPAGMKRGAMFALLVHVGLLIALAFGVNWRSSEPAGMNAELWAAVPQIAAPAAVEPPPPPPVALPKPLPEPKAPPKIEPPVQPKPETRDADIAIEKAKAEEKEKREREALEKKEQLERERLAKLEREKVEKLEREKAEKAAKAEREKAEQLEREKAEKLAREKAEKAEKLAKAEAAAQAARLEQQRQDNLKRMLGQAGATGAPQSTGTAQRDAGPSANYAGRIIARVRPNIVLTETVPATLRAEVEVRAAPDGTITSRRLIRSSGNTTWDDAVLRAIDRTETLPKDDNGRVPSSMVIGFTPN